MDVVSGGREGTRAGGATKVVNDSSSNLNKGQHGGRQRTGAWHVGVRATWPQKVEAQLTRCCRVTSATVASGFGCQHRAGAGAEPGPGRAGARPGLVARLDWLWV